MLSFKYFRTALICLLTAATLLLSACPPRQSIAAINRDPGRFHDREVTVAGQVVNSFAVFGVGAFELDDGTGQLWVFSNRYGIPSHGTGVAVTGKIEQGFSLAGRNFGTVLRETKSRG